MAQEILSIYKADVSNLISEVNKVVDANQEITKQEKDANKDIQKGIDLQESSSKKRLALLKQEEAELERLRKIRKLTYDPKDIALVDQKINQLTKSIQKSSAAIKQTGTETKKTFSEIGSSVKTIGLSIAASLGAAFTIDTIIQFGKASVNAFLEAQENAEKLRFTITQVGGESEAAFQRLIDQSEQLQDITIFSDDSIQQAQTALSTFGLTANQIEELLPLLADFASQSKTDIVSAAQAVGSGLKGVGREFKNFGIEVSATATPLENLTEITKGFAQFQGAAAKETETLTGQLKQQANAADDLQEQIGERLAPIFVKLKTVVFEAALGLFGFNKALDDIEKGNVDAVANNFEKAAKKIKESGGDIVEVFEKRLDTIKKSNQATIESNEKLAESLGSRQTSNLEKANARVQIEANEEIIRQNEIKIKQILAIIDREKSARSEIERTLSVEELRLKQTDELNKLLEENKKKNDSVSQGNVDLIERELEARKKLETEVKKNQENLLKLQIANIEDLKAQRIAVFEAETKALTSEGKLRADTIIEMEKQLVRDLNEIDKQRDFKPLVPIQPEVDFTEPEVKPINPVPEKLELPPVDGTEFNNSIDAIEAKTLAGWLDTNKEMLDASQSLINSLTELYDNYAEARIDQINREKDAQLDALDIEEKQIDSQLKRRGISEKEAEDRKAELTKRRIKIEEEAARKEREIKRKQFILDKAAALIRIIIETAENISSATNPALIALYAAVGAAQTAIVASQPIPYKKGSKDTGAKGHLARVGEEGEEIVFMPARSKVLPAKPTKTYGEVLNTMFDGTFDKHYMKREISPRLVKQRKNHEKDKEKQFAENIRESVTINNMLNSRGDYFLEKIEKQGVKFRNLDELYQIVNNNRQSPKR